MGRLTLLHSECRGGRIRASGRLLRRCLRPQTRSRLEHSALQRVGLRSGVLHVALAAIDLSLRNAGWCVGGICGCHDVACRTLLESQTSRISAWIYASLSNRRRTDGRGRLLPGRDLQRSSADDSSGASGLALHVAVRIGPSASTSPRSSVPSRISAVGRKKAGIQLERPHFSELFQPALLRTTLVATLLYACTYALPLGAIQHTVRMVSGLSDVRNLPPKQVEQIASGVQVYQELGGATGRILFAVFIVHVVSQRRRALLFFVPSLAVLSLSVFLCSNSHTGTASSGNFSRDHVFQRTPQCMGKLFA